MYQLAETCDLYESINPGVVDPEDNDSEDQHISQIAIMLKYLDKFPNLDLLFQDTETPSELELIYQQHRPGRFQVRIFRIKKKR